MIDQARLARSTAHAAAWNYASFGLGKVLVFVTTAVLARLLTPDTFGLLGFAVVTTNVVGILKDVGLGAAIIHRRHDVDQAADTAFTLNLFCAAILTVITAAIAPLAAAYFEEPLVTPILRVLGVTFVVDALGAVHIVRLQRALDFRKKLIPDTGRSLVKGLVSIACALAGFGVWSLVIGQVLGTLASVVLAWLVFPWRPRLVVHAGIAWKLLRFGLPLRGADTLGVVSENLVYFFVGRAFGAAALGVYTLAFRLVELGVLNALWVAASVLFPAYAALQGEPDALRRGFFKTVRLMSMLCFPLCVGLALTAQPVVMLILGPQWLLAIPIVRVLAGFALVASVSFNVGDIYKGTGRTRMLFALGLLNLALLPAALWLGRRGGLIGIALGYLAVATVEMIVGLWGVTRVLGVTVTDVLRQLRPALLGAAALALATLPTLAATAALTPLIRVLVATAAGGAAYLVVLWKLERPLIVNTVRLVVRPQRLPA